MVDTVELRSLQWPRRRVSGTRRTLPSPPSPVLVKYHPTKWLRPGTQCMYQAPRRPKGGAQSVQRTQPHKQRKGVIKACSKFTRLVRQAHKRKQVLACKACNQAPVYFDDVPKLC